MNTREKSKLTFFQEQSFPEEIGKKETEEKHAKQSQGQEQEQRFPEEPGKSVTEQQIQRNQIKKVRL